MCILKKEFQTHLPDARVARAGHITKQAAVEVSGGVVELGVVEKIEELGSELHRHALADPSVLVNGEIPVVETRSVEELPVGIAKSAQRPGDKAVLREEQVGPSRPRQPGILNSQGSN